MASRIDYSQNRKLYVGTTAELSVADGETIIDNKLIIGGSSSSLMLDVASDAIIGSINTASSTINYENKLIVAGKNNYSDGTTWFGSYGQILLSSNTNMTGSARQFLITNALDNNKFAIIRSVDASTNPVTDSTASGVNSGTADLVIDNTGKVGIGTTSPDYKFEVQGVISSADSSLQKATFANVGNDLVLTANADATNVTAKMLFKSSGTGGGTVSEKMSIQGDGTVVIGSSTLGGSKTLRLLSADNAVNYDIDFQQNGTTNHGRIRYSEGPSDLEFYPITGVNPNLTLKFNGNSYFQRGNVGIGTTNPATDLHVNSENAEGSLTISRDGNNMVSGQGVGSIVFPADYNGTPTNYGKIVTYANALSALRGSIDFKVKSTQGNLLTGLTVYGTSSGVNVGIGITNPAVPLDVEGKIRSNDSNSGDYLEIFCDGSVSGDSYIENTNNNIQIKSAFATSFSTSGSVAMFIKNNQYVGIGTTNPQYKLDVDGQIRAVGIVNIGGLGVAASGALANVDINDTDTNGTSTSYQPNITFKAAGVLKAQIGKLSGSTNYFTAAKNFDGPVNIIASEIHSGHTHSQEYIFGYEPANNLNTWGLNLVDGTNTANSLYLSAEGLNQNSSIWFGGYVNALLVTRISLNQTLGTWLYDCPDAGTSNVSVKWRQYNTGGYMQNMIDFEDDGDIKNINGSYGTISSDERVKENIVDATSKLDDILSLKVKNFNFIGDDKKQIGLIAQEVEEIFPTWVNTRDTRIYKTHDEDGNPLEEQGELVSGHEDGKSLKVGMEFAILTKAIQEQQEIIETLKQRIEQLEN